ncbi:MAG: Rpn family recombination-promoting nuclease/putative transposase [Defluviitaleaceae bacterium]|nr:Rpn family recombination-promoting nuclease/putative transposase [Defluviitaleaceae bacterium]MCL2239141.1 Rpn family recombination-promoting nuclease/putative transposase [Defluviitaleaceae bacterium]
MPPIKTKITIRKDKGTKLEYTFKSDVLFKMLFVRHPDLLKRLIAVLLGIPLGSIAQFQTINTEMPPEEIGKKFCRLDIHMRVDGKRVNLEIQVEDEGNYPERSMFHWGKMFTSSLPAGNDYSLLPKTIVISILGFKQFDCEEAHSTFAPMEINRHEILSDKQLYHFFELPKLSNVVDTTNEKDLWLALFNAETEEELETLIASGGEVMSQAVAAYRGITATEEFKYLEILRARTEHDEAQALNNARRQRDEHWQGVVANMVAEKDARIAELEAQLAQK